MSDKSHKADSGLRPLILSIQKCSFYFHVLCLGMLALNNLSNWVTGTQSSNIMCFYQVLNINTSINQYQYPSSLKVSLWVACYVIVQLCHKIHRYLDLESTWWLFLCVYPETSKPLELWNSTSFFLCLRCDVFFPLQKQTMNKQWYLKVCLLLRI